MGFFSKLFGSNKNDSDIKNAFETINKIIDDENYQLEVLGPAKNIFLTYPSFDVNPDGMGPFGFSETNPIPVNGPIGEISYLSRLETKNGDRLMFHRLGSANLPNAIGETKTVDIYEAVSINSNEWFIFYLDFYHPMRSRALPDGFRFTKDIPQFTGFNRISSNFPYDFLEMKESEQSTGLSFAYIPGSKLLHSLNAKIYQRPDSHMENYMYAMDLIVDTLDPADGE